MSRTVWDFLNEVNEAITEIRGDHAALESRLERMFRKGKVTDVDAKNQVYRQEIGLDDDGMPVKSPWVPYGQIAGARKIHSPPSIGQQMTLISPDGDHEQGVGLPFTFSNDQQSPSTDPNSDVDTRGKCKDTQTTKDGKDMRMIECGSSSLTLTDGNILFKVGGSSYSMSDGKIVETATNIALVGAIALGAEDASRELSLKGTLDSAGHAEQGNLSTKVKGV